MPTDPGAGGVDFTNLGSGTASKAPTGYLNNGKFDLFGTADIQDQNVFLGYSLGGNITDAAGGYGKTGMPGVSNRTNYGSGGPQSATISATDPDGVIREFASWATTNPQQYIQMQQELYAASKYGSGKPIYGVYTAGVDDDAMNKAIRSYLGSSGSAGTAVLSFADYLDRAAQQANANGGPGNPAGASRAPLQLTSTDTLNQNVNVQAQNELGRNYDTGEQQGFANKYHGKEQAAYNGATEQPGDASSEAKAFVDSNSSAEVQNHLQAGYAQKILSMLGVSS